MNVFDGINEEEFRQIERMEEHMTAEDWEGLLLRVFYQKNVYRAAFVVAFIAAAIEAIALSAWALTTI